MRFATGSRLPSRAARCTGAVACAESPADAARVRASRCGGARSALLLLNDHVLKGAGVLPGALTGKLSDFAGMLVAPPLAALVLGAGRAPRPRLAAALVGDRVCADQALAAMPRGARAGAGARCTCRSRIWLDASDLWALVLLPLGYALCAPAAGRVARRAVPAWLQRAGVALAALACIATTGCDDEKKDGGSNDVPQIENATGEPLP